MGYAFFVLFPKWGYTFPKCIKVLLNNIWAIFYMGFIKIDILENVNDLLYPQKN